MSSTEETQKKKSLVARILSTSRKTIIIIGVIIVSLGIIGYGIVFGYKKITAARTEARAQKIISDRTLFDENFAKALSSQRENIRSQFQDKAGNLSGETSIELPPYSVNEKAPYVSTIIQKYGEPDSIEDCNTCIQPRGPGFSSGYSMNSDFNVYYYGPYGFGVRGRSPSKVIFVILRVKLN